MGQAGYVGGQGQQQGGQSASVCPVTKHRSITHTNVLYPPCCCAVQVEYIFSDKTGTLTSNEMQLRQIAVKGVAYGSADLRLEEHMDKTGLRGLRLFDHRLYKAAARVQRSSSWSGLITAGGSHGDIMAHPTSFPNLESAGSLGLEAGGEEGAGEEYATSSPPGARFLVSLQPCADAATAGCVLTGAGC